jgi:hypothetical protein
MQIAKWKFFLSLILAAAVGAGATAGGFLATADEEPQPTSSPRPLSTPQPTPSLTPSGGPFLTPNQASGEGALTEADRATLLRLAQAYVAAQPEVGPQGVSGYTFAPAAPMAPDWATVGVNAQGGGGYVMMFKRSNGLWLHIWEGNGSPSDDEVRRYGIPRQ